MSRLISNNDITSLIYVVADDDIGLLNTEGIIEFVDPSQLFDSTHLEKSASYYDSLVATLPDFNLTSTIDIHSGAKIKIITNEQSGDYLEASGAAKLDLVYDRTGTLKLSGEYIIDKGLYRVSFYDLVKRNFELTRLVYHLAGSPKNGDLSITAENRVASNSIGLIANEVAENEQTIYKRSLDYIVGIHINGTIEKPIVSFSLDLSKEDRASYPVLASKLDRMKQPDFQTELNKQVFGLLVLGGFLPETSGADVDQGLIATTALSNSVNSLLAGQLNRFAGQYIKGVNIDVGLQSYSDYSAPGGKTKDNIRFQSIQEYPQ
ncbi:MAG: translocation/assembly module TamB domain-containing protein [Saprospiraceae bacterium]|nr:translocation/assembly module TamB domain-containing protein [Candidatus Opimibacter iunctus]